MHRYDADEFWLREFGTTFRKSELGAIVARLPLLGRGAWIAGGAVRRAVMGEKLGKDVDIFFASRGRFDDYRGELGRSACEIVPAETKSRVKFALGGAPDIDLVCGTYFSDPAALLGDFDFTCCCFATDGATLWAGEYALLHAANRILRVNNGNKLHCSLAHMERYLREGFTADKASFDALLDYGKAERAAALADYSGPHDMPAKDA